LVVISSKRFWRSEGSGASCAKQRVLCDAIIACLARFLIKPHHQYSLSNSSRARTGYAYAWNRQAQREQGDAAKLSAILNLPLSTATIVHSFLLAVLKFLKPAAAVAVLVYLQIKFRNTWLS
jgi:hypothetical protein